LPAINLNNELIVCRWKKKSKEKSRAEKRASEITANLLLRICMPGNLQECPHCLTMIFYDKDGNCPCCRKNQNEKQFHTKAEILELKAKDDLLFSRKRFFKKISYILFSAVVLIAFLSKVSIFPPAIIISFTCIKEGQNCIKELNVSVL
jgi:hypothetical protein